MPNDSRSAAATPREVWEQAHQHVRAYDLGAFADMFAPDGVLELPFAPPGIPRQLNGRESIREFLAPAGEAARSAGRRIKGYSSVVVHEATDPEVVIVEFDLDGEIVATGETYQLSYIQVLRVRNGRIVWMRDYMDPRVFARSGDS
jgi:ketosteroid isomerase-like protein